MSPVTTHKKPSPQSAHLRDVTSEYDRHAPEFAERYESLAFEQVHADILHLLPTRRIRVLDVGAGSGRDAAALAERGYEVWAVEPSEGMRRLAEALHGASGIKWVDDSLPHLERLKAAGPEKHDLILLSAVWMHLQPHDRPAALRTLASMIRDDGRIVITLRLT